MFRWTFRRAASRRAASGAAQGLLCAVVLLAFMGLGPAHPAVAPQRGASGSAPGSPAGDGGVLSDGYVWRDRDGNPLPFRNDGEVIEFLRTAEIEAIEDIPVGITNPHRVTLFKDGVRARAALRDLDVTYERMRFEREFYAQLRDSYLFDIAAYELGRMLGLGNIPPVTLRRVNGREVSVQIWLEGALVEWDRFEKAIDPPDEMVYIKQRQNMRVFDTVIGNVDRNNGNILYDAEWNHWLIDHSRSFLRDASRTPYFEEIAWCQRRVYERLKVLDRDVLTDRLSPPLARAEIDAILKRRDKVVARLDALIAERGEAAVLFDNIHEEAQQR